MNALYKHQQEFLRANPNKTVLVWSCGTGKTRAAIEWSKFSNPTLIICPKALKANWQREVKRWGGGFTAVLTKEEFRRDFKKLGPYGQVIVDEVHNGFLTPHFKSKMSKALRDYLHIHRTNRVLLLSATVYTSSPWNIYNLAWYLGHHFDWFEFNQTFFNNIWMGNRQVPVVKESAKPKLINIVKKIGNIVDINDVMDVPLQNHLDPEYFALTPDQKRGVEDNYDPVPIVRYTKQHEIENGVLIGNEYQDSRTFLCDKNERLLQLIEENPKVAVVCRYNAQIDNLLKLIKDKTVYVIRGATKDRDAITLAAEAAKECVVLIQADCAEGYQLPSFGLCVFLSQSYAYTKWEQICGRFLRMDKPSRTTFMYLLMEGKSIDQAVYDAIKKKEDFSIALYEKRSQVSDNL